jgi:hypothetical protein
MNPDIAYSEYLDSIMPPNNKKDDPCGPPKKSRLVECLHCSRQYQSSEIVYEERPYKDGRRKLWHCPFQDCSGIGYGFDILPVGKKNHTGLG